MHLPFLRVLTAYPAVVNDAPAPSSDPRVVRTRKEVLAAATTLLFDDGLAAVTHRRVAQASGYSRATIYSHWPTRAALLVDAFTPYADIAHPDPTGDVRADLVSDLLEFRRIMVEHRVDRALGLLVDLTASVPELRAVRRRVADQGEKMIRALLSHELDGIRLDAATHMLVGLFLNSSMMHGEVPSPELVEAAVDLVLPSTPTPSQTTPGAA